MISPETAERVLDRLGFDAAPAPDLAGLHEAYGAWCRTVPFDNLVKRIHLASADPGPFPNARPQAFFELFLAHGTGGTCWPSSIALHALLRHLGFDARLASAAMADDRVGPIHTHGTTIVRIGAEQFWVDSSMLTDEPVPLVSGAPTSLAHRLRPVRVEPVDELWRVWWRSPTFENVDIGCLLLDDAVTPEHYETRYEASRAMGPFNAGVYATTNRSGAVVGIANGMRTRLDAAGFTQEPLDADRTRVLVEDFGYSEAIVARLPADEPVAP